MPPHDARLTTPITPDLLRGAIEVEQTAVGLLPHRLPRWALAQAADPQLAMAESQPSGVRLAFRTRSSSIGLTALPTKRAYAGAPARPDGVYELVVGGQVVGGGTIPGGRTVTVDMMKGTGEVDEGEPGTVRFEGLGDEPKDVEVWLPHDETTELVSLTSDAPIEPAPPSGRPVWLHHGSSVSQGSSATSPTGTWPAVAALGAGADLVNLGFGGSALLDPFVARVIRDTPADLISVKLGLNVVNRDVMRLRAFGPAVHGLLDTIREGHPTTPLLVVSPVLCPIHEDTPGPSAPDLSAMAEGRISFVAAGDPAEVPAGRLTLNVIRTELARIVTERSATDPHLRYLDGRELYGAADHDRLPLPDGLHPDPATHRLIGERFAALGLSTLLR